MKTGIELITEERRRQIEKEGFDANHDAQHYNGELAMAAICYATPVRIYFNAYAASRDGFSFVDPFPEDWDQQWDKRLEYGGNLPDEDYEYNEIPDPANYTPQERIDLLIKAGALIAAEIDRLQRPCRVCGCTAMHACPGGCSWVDPEDDPEGRGDICSACLDKMEDK